MIFGHLRIEFGILVLAGGRITLSGVAIGITCSVVCGVAFVRCPRRCVLPKLLTFVFLWPGLLLGLAVVLHLFGGRVALLP